jgi:hypothetical protein
MWKSKLANFAADALLSRFFCQMDFWLLHQIEFDTFSVVPE